MSYRNHLAYIWRSGVEEKGEEEVVFFSRSSLTVKSKPKVLQNRKSFLFSKKALCFYSYRFLNILRKNSGFLIDNLLELLLGKVLSHPGVSQVMMAFKMSGC